MISTIAAIAWIYNRVGGTVVRMKVRTKREFGSGGNIFRIHDVERKIGIL